MIQSIWIFFVLYLISTYFLFLKHYFHYKIYAIVLISLHCTSGTSRCLFIDIYNTFSFLRTINRDYSRLSFDYIAYSANNMGESYVFLIYRHKGKCNSFIFIILIFFLSHRKHIQEKSRWMFIIFLHLVEDFVWYRSVFNQCSYYCDFFHLGPSLIICHQHRHV